ncbi:potassium-transporting ATPase subunit C [uncultured Enterococcus sp.]|uniref:potassium-transporting ATPase subunit C n=1 Tax=uncultured Enterococcus sp. TaxID=167972 RepID=UPI00258B9454|nr:potassium-transporting ATPase subunit C [uncultured Enterococcus sp.]
MKKSIIGSLRFLLLSVIVFGGLYTAAVTGIGQLFFSDQANGSQVTRNNQVVGSTLIGQEFKQAQYFSGRSEKVSQLSPVSSEQKNLVDARTKAELAKNPTEKNVPNDLVTASASGVDPNISLEAAEFQVSRISKERKVSQQSIRTIIEENSQKDWFSDRHYVNVLQLNLALDKL